MLLGRVIGSVWATEKDPSLDGLKLLIVREVGLDFTPKDKFVIAIDTVQAGQGEVVLLAQGSSARQTAATKNKPVDAVVMAIVDNLSVQEIEALASSYEARRAPLHAALDQQPEL